MKIPSLLLGVMLLAAPVRASEPGAVPAPAPHSSKSLPAAYAWILGATFLPASYYAWAAVNQHYGYERAFPLTVLGTGLVIGPSAGQFYAGSSEKGLIGMGIRIAAVPAGLLAGGLLASLAGEGSSSGTVVDDGDLFFSTGFFTAAMWVYIAGATYSLLDTPRAVRRANERAVPNVSLAPALFPLDEGRLAPGLAFTASF